MSQLGVVGPLQIDRQHAMIVGALIEARTAGRRLEGTPLALLPALGRKFRSASARKRASDASLVLWAVQRGEALAGFHYLAWFALPEADGLLTSDEAPAVHEVRLALATVLLARKGAKKLDREAVERRLEEWQKPPTSEQDPEAPDERWVRRLKRRIAADDALGATQVRSIPAFLLDLLTPPEISR